MPDPDDVPLKRIAVSGGEVLVWPELLFFTLREINKKYDARVTTIAVQTNGDLLDERYLDMMMEQNVCRIAVSSMDRYHLPSTLERRPYLEELFKSRGFTIEHFDGTPRYFPPEKPVVTFWGATEDLWIGPLWPRGRAEKNALSKATPAHDFCGGHSSGAKNFLNYSGEGCSVSIQLSDVYPCCALTCRPLGDLMHESLISMFDRCAQHPAYRALNEGRPEKLGEYMGLTEAYGIERTKVLGNHCLWCDEFFTKHAPELLHPGGRTERGTVDLTIRGKRLARKAAERARAAAMAAAS
jgi:hypothetical protein